jgi:F420-non-reducing hydrogenase small subunit
MPLVVSAHRVPAVDILLVSGGIHTNEDLYKLRQTAERAEQVVAVGTCAISGGVTSLGNRAEVRDLFLPHEAPRGGPHLLPRCYAIDTAVDVDLYVPGCPPTPELFMATLSDPGEFEGSRIVCQECGRRKSRDLRPSHLTGFQSGDVLPDICLINQGYLCIGSSTRGGCRAPCPRAGHPCVGCRGPSDAFVEREASDWFSSIKRVLLGLTDVPEDEIEAGLRSPQLALFLFQFSDYEPPGHGSITPRRKKENVL